MTEPRITALGGRVYRDPHGVWRHTDTDQWVPGSADLTLTSLYPDLVCVGDDTVLVPDALVRDNDDLGWVPSVSSGRTNKYDRQRVRGSGPTLGWSDVWPVPRDEWERRASEPLGIDVEGWAEGQQIPR